MRRALLLSLLLAACQITAPSGPKEVPNAMMGDAIEVTTLDAAPAGAPVVATPGATALPALGAPDVATPGADTIRPAPRPGDAAAEPQASPAAEVQPAPKSPEQILCEQSGGQWAVAGESGAMVCVRMTHDGGKICHRQTDCEGLCLARSGTCAPITPLVGCNEILDNDGRAMTLCIN